ncbi:MAG: hypothetical protein HUK11_10385 [Muribaculaceae bacterium]|nr:hypothetical protein [Muribaculaceae bacterium]
MSLKVGAKVQKNIEFRAESRLFWQIPLQSRVFLTNISLKNGEFRAESMKKRQIPLQSRVFFPEFWLINCVLWSTLRQTRWDDGFTRHSLPR